MYASLADRSTRKLLNRLARLDVLLIDELGYLNLKPEQSNIFFKLMEERYHPPLVSMATPLSGPLSDAGGCMISPRLARAAVFGQPRQNFLRFQEIIRCFSIGACFAALIVSLPPGAYRK